MLSAGSWYRGYGPWSRGTAGFRVLGTAAGVDWRGPEAKSGYAGQWGVSCLRLPERVNGFCFILRMLFSGMLKSRLG